MIANVAESLHKNKGTTDILDTLNTSYDTLYNKEKGIHKQTEKDITRTDEIAVAKNGITYKIPQAVNLEERRKSFIEINNENNLGLTGEQIDYILFASNQTGIDGAGSNHAIMEGLSQGKSVTQGKLGRLICVEIEGSNVSLTNHLELSINSDEDNTKQVGVVTRVVKANISGLQDDNLRPGLGSAPVYPTLELTTIDNRPDPVSISAPESVSTEPNQNPIKEYCRVSVVSQSDIDSIDKKVTFLSEKVNPLLLKETFAALKDVKNLSHDDQAQIAIKTIAKENIVNIEKATELIMSANPDLDSKRARRYMISVADDLGVKPNIGIGERISNLFSNLSDRFNGLKNPEQKLFGNQKIPVVKVTTSNPEVLPKKVEIAQSNEVDNPERARSNSVANGLRNRLNEKNKTPTHQAGSAQQSKSSGRGV